LIGVRWGAFPTPNEDPYAPIARRQLVAGDLHELIGRFRVAWLDEIDLDPTTGDV
jgi:hypothetical protein